MRAQGGEAKAQHLRLEGRLGSGEAAALKDRLTGFSRDSDMVIDADGVTHLSTLCLQVLLAASQDWQRAGRNFRLSPRSSVADAALATFAVATVLLDTEDR